MIIKRCTKCGEEKSLDDFYKHNQKKDGLRPDCKECVKPQLRNYHWSNRTKVLAAKAVYRESHRQELREKQRAYGPKWNAANPDKKKAQIDRRRTRKKDAFVEDVLISVLYARDKGICQLCYKSVDEALPWPEPLSKSIDHIIPLAAGGLHCYLNTQLAHLSCNQRKWAYVG